MITEKHEMQFTSPHTVPVWFAAIARLPGPHKPSFVLNGLTALRQGNREVSQGAVLLRFRGLGFGGELRFREGF